MTPTALPVVPPDDRVRAGACPAILRTAPSAGVSLAVWQRTMPPAMRHAAARLRAATHLRLLAEDTPAALARLLLAELPRGAAPLAADILMLARLFTAIVGATTLRLRLERIEDDSCRRFHVDAVGLRLLCTYAGAGTDWIAPGSGARRRLPEGAVAILKGSGFPGQPDAGLVHRSPPVSALPAPLRPRLLLTLDEPGRFP